MEGGGMSEGTFVVETLQMVGCGTDGFGVETF